jgi:hypothetical protein
MGSTKSRTRSPSRPCTRLRPPTRPLRDRLRRTRIRYSRVGDVAGVSALTKGQVVKATGKAPGHVAVEAECVQRSCFVSAAQAGGPNDGDVALQNGGLERAFDSAPVVEIKNDAARVGGHVEIGGEDIAARRWRRWGRGGQRGCRFQAIADKGVSERHVQICGALQAGHSPGGAVHRSRVAHARRQRAEIAEPLLADARRSTDARTAWTRQDLMRGEALAASKTGVMPHCDTTRVGACRARVGGAYARAQLGA